MGFQEIKAGLVRLFLFGTFHSRVIDREPPAGLPVRNPAIRLSNWQYLQTQ
jgi:hypothetical protein